MLHNFVNRYLRIAIAALLFVGVILLVLIFMNVRKYPDRQSQAISFISYDSNVSDSDLFNPLELATRLANKTALKHQIRTIGEDSYGNLQSSVLHISYEASREAIWKFWEDFNKNFNKEIKIRKYRFEGGAAGRSEGDFSNVYGVKTKSQYLYIYALLTEKEEFKHEFTLVNLSVSLATIIKNRKNNIDNSFLLNMEEMGFIVPVIQAGKNLDMTYLGFHGTDSTYRGATEFLRFADFSIPNKNFGVFVDNFREQIKKLIITKHGAIINEGCNHINNQPKSFFYTYKRGEKTGIFSSSYIKMAPKNEHSIIIIILELPGSW